MWQEYACPVNSDWQILSPVLFLVTFNRLYRIIHSHISLSYSYGTGIQFIQLSSSGFTPRVFNVGMTGITEHNLAFLAIGI